MVERRGARFVLEALFLIALAAALAFARIGAAEIGGIMLLGWLVAAALEWAVSRGEPHFGSGMPPRYHVPAVDLPPATPLEQVDQGYPDASRDEAPTWIASAALRAEVLGEWPVAAPPSPADGEEEVEAEDEQPVFVEGRQAGADPWTVAELPAEPLLLHLPEPVPVALPEPEPELELQAEPEPVRVEVREELPPLPAPVRVGKVRHHLDPLGDSVPRRRFGRGRGLEAGDVVEVDARPGGVRPLPGTAVER